MKRLVQSGALTEKSVFVSMYFQGKLEKNSIIRNDVKNSKEALSKCFYEAGTDLAIKVPGWSTLFTTN